MACGLTAPTISWVNTDLSSNVFRGIHMRAMSQEVLTNLIRNMCPEIAFLNYYRISFRPMSWYVITNSFVSSPASVILPAKMI